MSPTDGTMVEGLGALEFLLGLTGPWIPMELASPLDDFRVRRPWHDARGDWRLADRVRELDENISDDVRLSLGRDRKSWGMAGGSHFLWAFTESKAQLARLRAFPCRPTLVLRAKQARWAMWAMPRPASYEHVLRANRRLSYALDTKRKTADPDHFWIPAPGTCVRRDVRQPRPVIVELMEPTLDYSMGRLVGPRSAARKDPPDPDAWRDRAAG